MSEPEPPADMSSFKAPDTSSYRMETIRDPSMAMVIGIPLIGLMIAGVIYLAWVILA